MGVAGEAVGTMDKLFGEMKAAAGGTDEDDDLDQDHGRGHGRNLEEDDDEDERRAEQPETD